MKTSHLHDYHGLTQRAGTTGWVIQIRLLGRYRQLTAFTEDATEAARRHDIALSKLESFIDVRAKPNFPEDFSAIRVTRDAQPSEGYKRFFEDLLGLFAELHQEAEEAGCDPDALAARRAAMLASHNRRLVIDASAARIHIIGSIHKLRDKLPKTRLPESVTQKVEDLLLQAAELLDTKGEPSR